MSRETLAAAVINLYRENPSAAESSIEDFLQRAWEKDSPSQRAARLEQLIESCRGLRADRVEEKDAEHGEFPRLLSLLLGERVSELDFRSEEFLEKLARALNTLFDTLNQMIGVIHTTFLGQKSEMETIRLIIGSTLKGGEPSDSLQNYLNQIKEAFLISHRAFRQAAHKKTLDILNELDPDRISQLGEGAFGFGPFHKGKLFDIYKEEFLKCKGWVDSGRFLEEILREFEKNCQKQYHAGRGRSS